MLMCISTSLQLPTFLLNIETTPATSKFRPPRSGRAQKERRRYSDADGSSRGLYLDVRHSELPVLPSRYTRERAWLSALRIELEDDFWHVLDRSTWLTAICDTIELSADEDYMVITLADGNIIEYNLTSIPHAHYTNEVHSVQLSEGPDGKPWLGDVQVDNLLHQIHESMMALLHKGYLNFGDICQDIEYTLLSLRPEDGDKAFDPAYGEDEDTEAVKAELLEIRRKTRSQLLDIFRRFVLPWLRARLPATFKTWAVSSAIERFTAAMQADALHLARLLTQHTSPLNGPAELYLWCRALMCIGSASDGNKCSALPIINSNKSATIRIGRKRKLTPAESEEELLEEDNLMDDDDRSDRWAESSPESLHDLQPSAVSELNALSIPLAKELLCGLVDSREEDEAEVGQTLESRCFLPPCDQPVFRKATRDADNTVRKLMAELHHRLENVHEAIEELREALEDANEEDTKRKRDLSGAITDDRAAMGFSRAEHHFYRSLFTREMPLLRDDQELQETLKETHETRDMSRSSRSSRRHRQHGHSKQSRHSKRIKRATVSPVDFPLPTTLGIRQPLGDCGNSRALSRQDSLVAIGTQTFVTADQPIRSSWADDDRVHDH